MYICKLKCVFVLSMCILTWTNKVFINDESVDKSYSCLFTLTMCIRQRIKSMYTCNK